MSLQIDAHADVPAAIYKETLFLETSNGPVDYTILLVGDIEASGFPEKKMTVTLDLIVTASFADTPLLVTSVPDVETGMKRARKLASSYAWDHRWMDMANLVASWSKDRSRKTSAVIVDRRNNLVAIGYNGFPRGIDDTVECRHGRPDKYKWTEHAERNAIFNAAANGVSTAGTRIYMPWYPCAECARAIIQSDIREIIAVEPDWNDPHFGADFAVVREMLGEAAKETGLLVRFMPGQAPVAQKLA